jgi:hypothetical protein
VLTSEICSSQQSLIAEKNIVHEYLETAKVTQNAYLRIFSTVDTGEYKFLNVLAAKSLFILPKKITIKSRVRQSNKKGMPALKVIQTTSVLVPIANRFKKVLEAANVFKKVYEYIVKHHQYFTNFLQ